MTTDKLEVLTSKISLTLGIITGGLTLADWDLILGITLKMVSIISFIVVIAINVDKLVDRMKKWFN